MDVFQTIARRHSYRGPFTAASISREDLRKIVQAGIQAPSGYNGQSTSFVIVDDAGVIARIAEITGSQAIAEAPAVIVVVMDPGATRDKEYSFGVEDYAAAVENILLAVTALGYAAVWIDGALRREDRARRVAGLLAVPEDLRVRVVVPVGVPAERRDQKEKKPFAERAWFNCWGG